MATIGLKDVHYALLTNDPDSGSPSYDASVKVKGAMTANINPNASSATLFADDGPSDSAATMGEIQLELNLSDIPLPVQAIWLGHTYAGGILKKKGSDTPPWLAIGFRTLKSNGSYRYMWLNKGKFAIPEEDYATKGDSIEFKTPTITGSFVKRDCDDEWERTADSDETDFTDTLATNWFLGPVSMDQVILSATWAAGTASGSTKATATAGASNTLAYKKSASEPIAPATGAIVTDATEYTSGSDIAGVTANSYITLMELNSTHAVVKSVVHKVIASEVKV